MATSEKRSTANMSKMTSGMPRRSQPAASMQPAGASYVFKTRLAVKSLVVLAVVGPSLYAWHAYQVDRNAAAFLEQADTHEKKAAFLEQAGTHEKKKIKECWSQAAKLLHRYVQLHPGDVEARIRVAKDFEKGARTKSGQSKYREMARAAQLYATAIGYAPELAEPRRRQMTLRLELAELAGRQDDYATAEQQANELLQKDPDDRVARRVKALAMGQRTQLQGRNNEAIAAFKEAIEKNPSDEELATGLARLYRAGRNAPDAIQVMNELVDEPSSNKARAHLARYMYRKWEKEWEKENDPQDRRNDDQGADAGLAAKTDLDDLDLALEADVEHREFDVLFQAGVREAEPEIKNWNQAIEWFRLAVKAEPDNLRGQMALGQAFFQQAQELRYRGDDKRAVEAEQQAVEAEQQAVEAEQQAVKAWKKGFDVTDPDDVARQAELEIKIAFTLVRMHQWEKAVGTLDSVRKRIKQIFGSKHDELMAQWSRVKAEMELAQDRPAKAVRYLRDVETLQRAGAPSLIRTAELLSRLGACYAALKQWDQAALVYQQAADAQPGDRRLWRFAAKAAANAGLRNQAARACKAILALPKPLPDDTDAALAQVETYVALAQVEFQREAARRGVWRDFTKALEDAKKALHDAEENALPDSVSLKLKLLEAEYFLANPQAGSAFEQLLDWDAIKEAALSDRALAPRIANFYERAGKPDEADRVVLSLGEWEPSGAAAPLLSADLRLQRKQPDGAAEVLSEALPKLQGGARRDVFFRLAQLHLASEQTDLAEQELTQLANENKQHDIDDALPVQQLAELALKAVDLAKAEKWEDELKRLEGWEDEFRQGDGTLWRFFRAQRLVLEALAPENELSAAVKGNMIREADALQREIERLRPNWPPAHMFKARLALVQENKDEAIGALIQAIKLGEGSIQAYESLISLLAERSRIEEADFYLTKLRESVSIPSNLVPLAIVIDVLQQGERGLESAIRLAQDDLAKNPDNAERQLRLGNLLSLKPNEQDQALALQALQRARELAPGKTNALTGLFLYYARNRQLDAAEALLVELEDSSELSDDDRSLFLARCYQTLKDLEKARTHYLEAVRLAQGRADVLLQAAGFFFERDPKQAEKCLRRVLEISDATDPNNERARRTLAVLLETHRELVADRNEVNRLLPANGAGGVANRRTHALILIQRGGSKNRRQAQDLLEALAADPQVVTPSDHLWLSRLYEAQGNLTAAREQFQRMVSSDKPAPDHLAAYLDFLLRTGQSAEATNRLDKLSIAEPETSFFRTLELRARWLKAQNRSHEIPPKVEAFVQAHRSRQVAPAEEAKMEEARMLVDVGKLYASLKMPEAEESFVRAKLLDPSSHTALAIWLVKQGRAKEALELCLQTAETDETPLSAMTLCSVMAMSKPEADDRRRAQQVVETALARFPEHVDLAFSASTWKLMDGDDDEAITLLTQILDMQPNHRPALNNLAILLSAKPDRHAEALACIDRAIDLAGMVPELLDSKGWVLLQTALADEKRRSDVLHEAQELFVEATTLPPGDARHWFHLALAYQLQNNADEAHRAWKQVVDLDFDPTTLSPCEQIEWDRLEQSLR